MRGIKSAVPTSSGAVGTAERAPCHIQNASAAFAHPTACGFHPGQDMIRTSETTHYKADQ
jgi:hypothetical protein